MSPAIPALGALAGAALCLWIPVPHGRVRAGYAVIVALACTLVPVDFGAAAGLALVVALARDVASDGVRRAGLVE
ncbi:MAG: hypothetical protein C4344_05825, partial [Acidimicrobiia bacterium]